jgi:hypothetical protein
MQDDNHLAATSGNSQIMRHTQNNECKGSNYYVTQSAVL